jgi:hypothetical protein
MLPTASVLFCDEGRPSDFEKPRSARMWQPFVTNAPQGRGLPKWQEALYIAMERNSVHVREYPKATITGLEGYGVRFLGRL